MYKHFKDKYVKQSHKLGLRSRAWFKLDEIQKIEKIFHHGMVVLDLGSSPGSWSQYAATCIGSKGNIISCDILPMKPIKSVYFMQGNLCNRSFVQMLLKHISDKKIQIVLSDMAPNMSGTPLVDISRSMSLVNLALDICQNTLVTGGSFLVKIFQGESYNEYLKKISLLFTSMKIYKPAASRSSSREVYVMAKGRKNIKPYTNVVR